MEAIPNEFFCPISRQVMHTPVLAPDGKNYEKDCIKHWLTVNPKTPFTNVSAKVHDLKSNPDLAAKISTFYASHPEAKEYGGKLKMQIKTMKETGGTSVAHIKVIPPQDGPRKPSAIVCVIDVSGSMGDSAAAADAKGEDDGFSILDLVKHSIKTIINVLDPQDYLSLIAFSTSVENVMDLQPMTEEGKEKAIRSVDMLRPLKSTNLWGGLQMAIDNVNKNPLCSILNTSVWVFTDGLPNKNPPKGIIPTLLEYLRTKNTFITMNTFGFGYKLDSSLLYEISKIGRGIIV